MLRHLWAVPFADEEQRREYMRDYHAEFRVGLRRSGTPAEVEKKMDERRLDREAYLRAWAAANRERRSAARREQRREARRQALAAALGKLSKP
jgi:hypothetical protein